MQHHAASVCYAQTFFFSEKSMNSSINGYILHIWFTALLQSHFSLVSAHQESWLLDSEHFTFFFFFWLWHYSPFFLRVAVSVSFLSIRNHLEPVITLWQTVWELSTERGEDKSPCFPLSFSSRNASSVHRHTPNLSLKQRKWTKHLRHKHTTMITLLRIMNFKRVSTLTHKSNVNKLF